MMKGVPSEASISLQILVHSSLLLTALSTRFALRQLGSQQGNPSTIRDSLGLARCQSLFGVRSATLKLSQSIDRPW
jgi:hypothetical protein